MSEARDQADELVTAYKAILSDIIDLRPSGTRQRLSVALGKHRSFVTQITSPTYATPLPSRHLATIFQVCHFSEAEKDRFLQAYERAHPGKLPETRGGSGLRQLSIMVPDLGDAKKNRALDDAIASFVVKVVALSDGGDA